MFLSIDKTTLAKAFEAWESDFRVNPENFLTHEESAALGVSEASAERADYFYQLLKQLTISL